MSKNSGHASSKLKTQLLLASLFVLVGSVFLGVKITQKPKNVIPGLAALSGDCNSDGKVDIIDFQLLSNSFGLSSGQTGYYAGCDFNADNTINILDFQILSNNFGKVALTPTPSSVPTNTPTPATGTPTPTPISSGGTTIVAVGDIMGGSFALANKTLIDTINPAAILGLGDFQYTVGDCPNFLTSGHYDSNWGAENWRMWPTFGPTHDYDPTTTSHADIYFSGNCSGQKNPKSPAATALGGTIGPMQPYSFDIGTWHIISLPSLCYRYGCDSNAITTWLSNDLSVHTNKCTIAYFHEPYWTSTTTSHARLTSTKPWVQLLYDHGVELLLSGHNHDYERFYPQNMSDLRDDAKGITNFVVGTGGIGFYTFTDTAPNSATRSDSTYGVLKLVLGSGSYTWQFIPTSGGTYTDSGSGTCH